MGQRMIRVSREYLLQALHLPTDIRIVDVSEDFWRLEGDIILKVESPMFSEVAEGSFIPEARPQFTNTRLGCGCYETSLTKWDDDAGKPVEPIDWSKLGLKIREADEPVVKPRGREFI